MLYLLYQSIRLGFCCGLKLFPFLLLPDEPRILYSQPLHLLLLTLELLIRILQSGFVLCFLAFPLPLLVLLSRSGFLLRLQKLIHLLKQFRFLLGDRLAVLVLLFQNRLEPNLKLPLFLLHERYLFLQFLGP